MLATGRDIRREEEQLIARQRQLGNNQNVVVQMEHAPAYADYESEVRGEETFGKSRIGMRTSNNTSPAMILQSIEQKELRKSSKHENKGK